MDEGTGVEGETEAKEKLESEEEGTEAGRATEVKETEEKEETKKKEETGEKEETEAIEEARQIKQGGKVNKTQNERPARLNHHNFFKCIWIIKYLIGDGRDGIFDVGVCMPAFIFSSNLPIFWVHA